MCFQLYDGRLHLHVFRQVQKTGIVKITQADGADFTCMIGFLHGTVGTVIVTERLVDEQEVYVVGL